MDKTIKRRCQLQLHALDLPDELVDLDGLVAHMALKRGRTITVSAWQSPDFSAAWIETEDEDLVFYEQAATLPHQQACICHELAHMILKHSPNIPIQSIGFDLPMRTTAAAIMLGRSCRQGISEQEQEAEVLGTMLLRHVAEASVDAARLTEPLELALRRRWRR